jgi:hypothetical protein
MAKSHFTRIVLFVSLAFSASSNASFLDFDIFADVVVSSYDRPEGSLWQQDFAGYPTNWGMNPVGYRIGVGKNGFRLTYANLGKYKIDAEAGDDEDMIVACRCRLAGDTDWYYTKGEIRAYTLSYKYTYKGWFAEYGIGMFRQSLKISKDDGWRFNETLWGRGAMYGFGYDFKDVSVGLYSYQASIGAEFGESNGESKGAIPSGTNGAFLLTIGLKF